MLMPYICGMEKIIAAATQPFGGTKAGLARVLGVSTMTVCEWASGRRDVPPRRALQIEQLTGGAVGRVQLRPGDYWTIWPDLPAPANTPTGASAS